MPGESTFSVSAGDQDAGAAPVKRRRRSKKKDAEAKPPRIAEGYVYATHPDTRLDVVFLKGERLPDWAGDGPKADEVDTQDVDPT